MSQYLYVVKRSYTDLKTPAEISYKVSLPATFTDLKAAKAAARRILVEEGYEPSFFSVYEVKKEGDETWGHGDGVIVYAEGEGHEVFKVEIETVPNTCHLEGDENGHVNRPLHHILQTTIHYIEDSSGSKRDSNIEGTYTEKDSARAEALEILLDEDVAKDDFVEYNVYADEEAEKPFGEEVLVHAVKDTGENFLISVVSDNVDKI
jgi:hypothetical protein